LTASALLAVERKKPGVERLVTNPAAEAEKTLVENLLAAIGDKVNHAIAQT
jgi:hypothetical protein